MEWEEGYLTASVLVEKVVTLNQTEKRHKGLSVKQAVTISDLPMKEGKKKTRIIRMFEF